MVDHAPGDLGIGFHLLGHPALHRVGLFSIPDGQVPDMSNIFAFIDIHHLVPGPPVPQLDLDDPADQPVGPLGILVRPPEDLPGLMELMLGHVGRGTRHDPLGAQDLAIQVPWFHAVAFCLPPVPGNQWGLFLATRCSLAMQASGNCSLTHRYAGSSLALPTNRCHSPSASPGLRNTRSLTTRLLSRLTSSWCSSSISTTWASFSCSSATVSIP